MRVEDLIAYQKSFDLAMRIFQISKTFPVEERYSLTDQIRRSSRSVTASIAEAYIKRNYVKHFVSKLTDSDAENTETYTWLKFALACEYIDADKFEELKTQSEEIGKSLYYMMNNPHKFGVKS